MKSATVGVMKLLFFLVYGEEKKSKSCDCFFDLEHLTASQPLHNNKGSQADLSRLIDMQRVHIMPLCGL